MQNWLNVRPFCESVITNSQSNSLEFTWADTRDIQEIWLIIDRPAEEVENLGAAIQSVKYWRDTWPAHRPLPGQQYGSGQSGWARQDDWYKGTWQSADIIVDAAGGAIVVRFQPLNVKEFPSEIYAVQHRRTLKLRVELNPAQIPVDAIRETIIYTTSELFPAGVVVQLAPSEVTFASSFKAEVFNGVFTRQDPGTWRTMKVVSAEGHFGQPLGVFYCHDLPEHSFDQTLVTITPVLQPSPRGAGRPKLRPFTFTVSDLLDRKHLVLPDLGILVTTKESVISYADAEARRAASGGEDVYHRVAAHSEQTFQNAMRAFEGKIPFYMVLGCEGTRSKCAVTPAGDIYVSGQYLRRVPGPDTPRVYWDATFARVQFSWGVDHEVIPREMFQRPSSREIEEGYLPIITTGWKYADRGLSITQIAFATLLKGTRVGLLPAADDPVVVFLKFRITNDLPEPRDVSWGFSVGQSATLEKVEEPFAPVYDSWNFARTETGPAIVVTFQAGSQQKPRPPYSCVVQVQGSYRMLNTRDQPGLGALAISLRVAPKHHREVLLALPLLALDDGSAPRDVAALQKLDFSQERGRVGQYWKARSAPFTRIEVPERDLALFYKAHVNHVLITNDRALGADRVVGRVGSFRYGCYPNEVCMVVQDLDRRGCFGEACKILDTLIHYQGTAGLDGAYEEMDGIFFGANGYESGPGYNQNQGWVLWTIAEHARLAGDWDWLRTNAGAIIKGCEWIMRERAEYTKQLADARARSSPKKEYPYGPLYEGLLPPGGVEDITDYWHWLSTNAYNSYGLARAAGALKQVGNSAASQIATEAKAYVDAVRACFLRLMERSPVVPLRNGTYIPHVPCKATRRGRGFGWIQETLEGAIHLLRCGILPPHSQEATWIIQDLEDNLYLSEEYGYPVTGSEFDQHWFDRGGFSQQPFLLCNHFLYAARNEPKHFLRAFFNSFAISFRPDTKMFTEHPLPGMLDWRGDHFKTSDEANACTCLRAMLVQETRAEIDLHFMQGEDTQKFPLMFPPASDGSYTAAFKPPDSLRLFALTPREWLADGKAVRGKGLVTYFGHVDIELVSHVATGAVIFTILIARPSEVPRLPLLHLFFTFRHPDPGLPIKSVALNSLRQGEQGDKTIEVRGQRVHFLIPPAVGEQAQIVIAGRVRFT